MILWTTCLALLALLVRVSVSLPHGAKAALKVPTPVPPVVGQQNQHGQHGGGRTAVSEASATLLRALGLGGVGVLEWWRRKHAAKGNCS